MEEDKLGSVLVKDISHLIVMEPALVSSEASIREVMEKIILDTRSRHAYIVDEEGVLMGSIRVNNLIQYLFPTSTLLESPGEFQISSFLYYTKARQARDIMNVNPSYVHESTPIVEMIRIMTKEKINELPIVDNRKRVIGEVNVLEIIAYYLKNQP